MITLRLLGGFSDLLQALLSVNDSPCDIYKAGFFFFNLVMLLKNVELKEWVWEEWVWLFLALQHSGVAVLSREQSHGFIPCFGTFLAAFKAVMIPLPGCHVHSLQGFRIWMCHIPTTPWISGIILNLLHHGAGICHLLWALSCGICSLLHQSPWNISSFSYKGEKHYQVMVWGSA